MRAIEIPQAVSIEKSTERTASGRREFRWQVVAIISFSLSATAFGVGSVISALTSFAVLLPRAGTAYLTVGSLVGSLAFAFFGAHAMDKLDHLNR